MHFSELSTGPQVELATSQQLGTYLLLVAFLLLVAMPFVPSSVLVPILVTSSFFVRFRKTFRPSQPATEKNITRSEEGSGLPDL